MTIKEALDNIYSSNCPQSVLVLLKRLINQMEQYETPSYIVDITIQRIS